MIGIIDYKAGNTCSVQHALDRLNVDYVLTDDIAKLSAADKLIFPGVGHAKAAMEVLTDTGIAEFIKATSKPLLGICLGMQLLCAKSEESNSNCLNIIPLNVVKFTNSLSEQRYKVPHMGWNSLENTQTELFQDIQEGEYCYFVHSYYVPISEAYTIAESSYIQPFAAAVAHKNYYGVQFHPEKSGDVGERILKAFVSNE